jgi:hypothetical protein
MRKHVGISSAAQYLDGTRLTGRLQIPGACYLRLRPSGRKGQ